MKARHLKKIFSNSCLPYALINYSIISASSIIKHRKRSFRPRSIKEFIIVGETGPAAIRRAKLQFPVNSTVLVTLLLRRVLTNENARSQLTKEARGGQEGQGSDKKKDYLERWSFLQLQSCRGGGKPAGA